VAIVRAGTLVHEQSLEHLRRCHRIRARLRGGLTAVPAALAESVSVVEQGDGTVVMEAGASLAPLLGWLATLPLDEVRVEPVGLAAVYDRFHRAGARAPVEDVAHGDSPPELAGRRRG
jgi:ABC-2 type transport system ATP-binding protein